MGKKGCYVSTVTVVISVVVVIVLLVAEGKLIMIIQKKLSLFLNCIEQKIR